MSDTPISEVAILERVDAFFPGAWERFKKHIDADVKPIADKESYRQAFRAGMFYGMRAALNANG